MEQKLAHWRGGRELYRRRSVVKYDLAPPTHVATQPQEMLDGS